MFIRQYIFKLTVLISVCTILLPIVAPAQSGKDCDKQTKKQQKVKISKKPNRISFIRTGGISARFGVGDAEKAIAVSPKVFVSFCVSSAPVKINGWKRKEVRAFVKGREDIEFRVRERTRADKKPVWVEVFGVEKAGRTRVIDSCISGSSVELDVPYGASVSIYGKSGQTSVEIDSIKKAKVEIYAGDISVSNVTYGLHAATKEGGVSVRNSSGSMNMETVSGNIVAYETDVNEIGDSFKAKTRSGAITMQSIGQKEVEASSISGSINFVGTTKDYGNYSFTTTNGLITLAMPSTASFRLKAAYGGSFISEFPLEDIVKEAGGSTVYLTGSLGSNNRTTVTMRSFSGTIRFLKTDRKKVKNWFL